MFQLLGLKATAFTTEILFLLLVLNADFEKIQQLFLVAEAFIIC